MSDVVLAIGNTGCGKSTLLSAIVFSPDALEKKMVVTEVKQSNGNIVKKKQWVIDRKKYDSGLMKIGHSTNTSETFFPTQIRDPNSNLFYTDIAGLHDTGGQLMEYINQFINKKIFNLAKKVRILIPMTIQQIYDSRGQVVREQVEIVLGIFRGNIDKMPNAIIPIITKVKPVPKDYEENNFDMDQVRESLNGIFQNWLELYQREKKLDKELIQKLDKNYELLDALMKQNGTEEQAAYFAEQFAPQKHEDENSQADIESNQMPAYLEYCQLRNFLRKFASNAIAVDPLDRELWAQPQDDDDESTEDHGTKIKEVVEKIHALTPAEGKQLFVPLKD